MYGYIPIENVSQLQQSYSIASPINWQFEKAGKKYAGVEDIAFTQAQKAELIGLGGGWFATGQEFGQWQTSKPNPTTTPFLFEVAVSATRTLVCNLPLLTGGSSFVLDVTVRDTGASERTVQLVCTNTALVTLPNGSQVPEFAYLVAAIRADAGLNTLTTQMLTLRNSQGFFELSVPQ